jgi:hypothetical protein
VVHSGVLLLRAPGKVCGAHMTGMTWSCISLHPDGDRLATVQLAGYCGGITATAPVTALCWSRVTNGRYAASMQGADSGTSDMPHGHQSSPFPPFPSVAHHWPATSNPVACPQASPPYQLGAGGFAGNSGKWSDRPARRQRARRCICSTVASTAAVHLCFNITAQHSSLLLCWGATHQTAQHLEAATGKRTL